jgi:hypothetical protein
MKDSLQTQSPVKSFNCYLGASLPLALLRFSTTRKVIDARKVSPKRLPKR